MNSTLFDHKRIAEGYASRPWLHKTVIERVKMDYDTKRSFRNGLDVGCGAGLSTKALKLICEKVTGTDISEAMIHVCQGLYPDFDYSFYCSCAENTEIFQEPYDIVTAAGVINWVDKKTFLEAMHRVMVPDGLLLIYDFELSDLMKDGDSYTYWYRNIYLQEFPRPPRNEKVWTQEDVGKNFVMRKQVNYQMGYEFSLDEFICFMMIQSNVNIQIEEGKKKANEVHSWMQKTLQPVFKNSTETLFFKGYSWYIEHIGEDKRIEQRKSMRTY